MNPDSSTDAVVSRRPGIDAHIDLRERQSGMDTFFALVEATDDSICVVDARGIVRFANRAADELLLGEYGSMLGRTFGIPVLLGITTEVDLVLKPGSRERRRRLAEMRCVEVEWRGEACALVSLRDITARKRTEEKLRRSEEQFRSLATASPIGIFATTIDGTVGYGNPRLVEILGDLVEGTRFLDLAVDDDRSRLAAIFQTATQGELSAGIEFRAIRADGSIGWLRVRLAPTFDSRGRVRGIVGSLSDITVEKESRMLAARLSSIIDATTDLVAVSDLDGEFSYLNGAARSFLGIFEGGAFLSGHRLPDLYPSWAKARFKHTVLPAVLANDLWSGDMAVVRADGTEVPVSQVSLAHRNAEGEVEFIATIARDITDTKEMARRLEHQALHDPLTGLPNRSLFTDRLEFALARLVRRKGHVGVLFIDLDRFKTVNDTFGHIIGDQLIVEVANRLRNILRPGDTVARLSGDEFVVLCEDLTGLQEAQRIARRLVDCLAQPFELQGAEVYVSGSVGVAVTNDHTVTATSLLRDADAAMYQAKELGKNRFEIFDETMREKRVDRAHLEFDLHRALERGELFIEYQPEVDTSTGKICVLEALIRWTHPERGRLGPDEFIPMAEETGLVIQLGEWTLREACRRAKAFQVLRQHPDDPPIVIAVNLSGKQLAHPDLVRTVAECLDDTGVDPSLISIEVTESVLMGDLDISSRRLDALRSLGLSIGIDDFGTGYSSLAHLRSFPVEFLKIDRMFVRGLGEAGADSAIAEAVIALAHTLGLRAVAEGVETIAQLEALKSFGCDLVQGWLVGRPERAEVLLELGATKL